MKKTIAIALSFLVAPAAARAQAPGIVPATLVYNGRVEYQGQTEDGGTRRIMVSDATIGGTRAWVVVNDLKIPEGTALDSVAMAADGLRPLFRRATIGDSRLVLVAEDSVMRGQIKAPDQTVPLSIPLGEGSFLNYYALRAAFPAWPMAAGWSRTVSALELNGRSEFTPLEMAVEGDEKITVPAGEFDCWIVHVTGSGGIDERYWVSKDRHLVVRTREPIGRPGMMLQLDLASVTPAP